MALPINEVETDCVDKLMMFNLPYRGVRPSLPEREGPFEPKIVYSETAKLVKMLLHLLNKDSLAACTQQAETADEFSPKILSRTQDGPTANQFGGIGLRLKASPGDEDGIFESHV